MFKRRLCALKKRFSAYIKTKKAREAGKTVLIIALLISAVILEMNAGFLGLGDDSASQSAASGAQQSLSGSSDLRLAGPYVMVITSDSGSHCALMYDGLALRQAHESLSAYLGEAMGTAGEPQTVPMDRWEGALRCAGVFFDYGNNQPLSLLATTLGVTMTGSGSEHTARRLCLCIEDGGVALYYIRARDGLCYRCDTAMTSSAISARLGDYRSNGAAFLFETSYEYELVNAYFVLPEGQAQLNSVSASNPLGTLFTAAALSELFGVNSYLASYYTEADGTDLYVEGDKTLRIYADGTVQFRNSDETHIEGSDSMTLALETAALAVNSTIGSAGGIESAGLSYISYDQNTGAYTVRYEYEINGIPVALATGPAAELTIVGGVITAAQLSFRQYSYSGDTLTPLPALQAAAIVESRGGGTPVLSYTDTDGVIGAEWRITD